MIVLSRPDQLDLAQYRRIVVDREPVALDPAALAAVGAARERLLSHLDTGVSAYGVNTGVGYLARTRAGPRRAAGVPARAARPRRRRSGRRSRPRSCAARCCSASPASSPAPRACRPRCASSSPPGSTTAGRRSCPRAASRAPARSSRSATSSRRWSARATCSRTASRSRRPQALARRGVAPYEPGVKEGHRAGQRRAARARADRVARRARARALLDHATLAGALTAALTGASLRPYSPRVGALKGDPGQQRIHAALLALHAGGADWSDRPQSPVSLRVLPQVHGAALDLLDHVDAQVGARAARGHRQPALPRGGRATSPPGCTRAATSTPRRSASGSTRSRSRSRRSATWGRSGCTGCSTTASPGSRTSSRPTPAGRPGSCSCTSR